MDLPLPEMNSMSNPHESATTLMRLYELRREDKMRDARTYVVRGFNPKSVEEVGALMGTEEYTYVRMVVGYWDMAASFVVHGAIDPSMFRELSGEMLATYCKFEHMIDEIRETFGQPGLLANVQKVVEDWPGAQERMEGMRAYFHELAANS